jgi:hypothetical protein
VTISGGEVGLARQETLAVLTAAADDGVEAPEGLRSS